MNKPRSIVDSDPKAPVAANARAILAARTAELFSHDAAFTDPNAVAALHQARIAAKRLRYTLELFPAIFGDDGTAALADVRALQDALGIVHDRDVMIAAIHTRLGELISERGPETDAVRASLESILTRVRTDREARHRDAAARWRVLSHGKFRDRLTHLAGTSFLADDG
ncbi:MAG: CHAD domain-containing protein [Thermomicrobiales bacterium]